MPKSIIKIKKEIEVERLNFLLVHDFSEGFVTAFVESDCQLSPFAFFVGFSRHLPSFCRVFNFFSASWAFCHGNPWFMLSYASA